MNAFLRAHHILDQINPICRLGEVVRVAGGIIESRGPALQIGDLCHILTGGPHRPTAAEVVGFRKDAIILMPLHDTVRIAPGAQVKRFSGGHEIAVGPAFIGRVVNALGHPIDEKGPILAQEKRSLMQQAPHPLKRKRIQDPLETGVRAIDGLLTLGQGQRIGIFAGSGVGKSVLLGMIARYAQADVNVIALIGERGREVTEFIEQDLGEDGLAHSVVVVATSDEMPLMRKKAALLATTLAEYFRDQGMQVILMMDSLTRVAMAQREIGLAAGEPPTTRGYTPSTFSFIPRLLERAGRSATGSITGIYTVLVEGDDMDEPVADTARGTLDGHIVLSRSLAARAHFPAIDVLQSTSRVMPMVVSQEHLQRAQAIKELMSVYRDAEDLIAIGAYQKGSNPRIDAAISRMDQINRYLKQSMFEHTAFEDNLAMLEKLAQGLTA